MAYIDLHTHTTYSDGASNPCALVRELKQNGIEVMAITDHDHIAAYFTAKEEAKKWNIQLIPGAEVTTAKYHILGLNVDPHNKIFQDTLRTAREYQREECALKIKEIQKLKIPITMEKLLNYYPESRVGSLNIANTIVMDPECKDLVGKQSKDEIFQKYLRSSKTKGISGPTLDAVTVIDAIHTAKGVAVLAHPGKDVDNFDEIDTLIRYGLDGIEMQPSYRENHKPFVEYGKKKGLFVTYGSDFHGAGFGRNLLGRIDNNVENIEELLNKNK